MRDVLHPVITVELRSDSLNARIAPYGARSAAPIPSGMVLRTVIAQDPRRRSLFKCITGR